MTDKELIDYMIKEMRKDKEKSLDKWLVSIFIVIGIFLLFLALLFLI